MKKTIKIFSSVVSILLILAFAVSCVSFGSTETDTTNEYGSLPTDEPHETTAQSTKETGGKTPDNTTTAESTTETKPQKVSTPTSNEFFDFTLLENGTYSVVAKADIALPENIVVPSTYNGKAVTEIGDYAFKSNDSQNRTLFDENIKSIEIPEGVKKIGNKAFNSSHIWDYEWKSKLESIIIPNSIEYIGDNELDSIPNLIGTTVGVVSYLGNETNPYLVAYKFDKYTKDTNVKIEDGAKIIASYTFDTSNGCDITNVDLPDSVVQIGYRAIVNTSIINIDLPKNLIYISWSAFSGTDLNSIVIPDSVTTIERDAFRACDKLTTVEFGKNLQFIGEGAFSYCENLTNVVLPEGLKTIEKDAFRHCDNLETIEIPDSIECMGRYIFNDCDKLAYHKENGVTYLGNAKNPYVVLVKAEKSISELKISEGVAIILDNAVTGCENITNIVFPSTLNAISEYAFHGCKSLTEIVIPEGVVRLETNCFTYCEKVEKISLPSTIEFIGTTPFSLHSIDFPISYNGTIAEWNASENNPLTVDSYNNNYYNITISCTDGDIVLTKQ